MKKSKLFENSSPKLMNKTLNDSSHLPEIREKLLSKRFESPESVTNISFIGKNTYAPKTGKKFKEFELDLPKWNTKRKEEIMQNNGLPKAEHEDKELIKACERDYNILINVPKLTISVLEVWINTTLKEIEISTIPRQYLNIQGKNPLSRFGIDREKLIVIFILQ